MNLNLRERGNLLQVCIPTGGCRLGKCIFCNYGKSVLPDLNELETELTSVFQKYRDKQVILVNAMGSVFDKQELPFCYVETIASILAKFEFPNLVFETHYTTITEEICMWLRSQFPNTNLYIELGLESIYSSSLEAIHKKIVLSDLDKKIQIKKKYHILLEGNVFLGIPFLSREDRIQDSVDTIQYALNNGFDEVVLFPCNLKIGTELYDLYSADLYEMVSHSEVIECLSRIDSSLLRRVSLSWYGDWKQYDEGGKVVNLSPSVCDEVLSDEKKLVLSKLYSSFYEEYLVSDNRKELVQDYKVALERI